MRQRPSPPSSGPWPARRDSETPNALAAPIALREGRGRGRWELVAASATGGVIRPLGETDSPADGARLTLLSEGVSPVRFLVHVEGPSSDVARGTRVRWVLLAGSHGAGHELIDTIRSVLGVEPRPGTPRGDLRRDVRLVYEAERRQLRQMGTTVPAPG